MLKLLKKSLKTFLSFLNIPGGQKPIWFSKSAVIACIKQERKEGISINAFQEKLLLKFNAL